MKRLSQFLMTRFTANAHADQFVALGAAFGFPSEFQFGAGTVNHANLIRMSHPVGVTLQFPDNLGWKSHLKTRLRNDLTSVERRDSVAAPKRIRRAKILEKTKDARLISGRGVYRLQISLASEFRFCRDSLELHRNLPFPN